MRIFTLDILSTFSILLLYLYLSRILKAGLCNWVFVQSVLKEDAKLRTNQGPQLPETHRSLWCSILFGADIQCDVQHDTIGHIGNIQLNSNSTWKRCVFYISLLKTQFEQKRLHRSVLWGISVILVRLGCPSLHWNALKPHSHVGSTVLIRRNGHEKLHSSTLWNSESQNVDTVKWCHA